MCISGMKNLLCTWLHRSRGTMQPCGHPFSISYICVNLCNLWTKSSSELSTMNQDERTYAIIGACFDVYNQMGCGFLEAVYQECLGIELDLRKIPFVAQHQIKLFYKESELTQKYVPDFICFDNVIVELKALIALKTEHHAQLINYLKATRLQTGLLVNFGHYPKLEYKRMVL